MKRITFFLVLSVFLASVFWVIPVSAADMSGPVGAVNVAYGTPVADGKIDKDEYTAHVTINDKNMKAVTSISYNVPETHNIEVYFSWDNSNLYIAYDVTDPTQASSVVDENGNWLFNGDNIQFFADFGPTLAYRELTDTAVLGGRRSSLFAAGMNEDASYFLLHQLSQNDAILNLSPDAPPIFGKITDKGWVFEFSVPWSMLMKDMTDKTGIALSEDNVGNGTKINCLLIYNDYETAGVIKNMFGTTSTGYEDPFDWQPEVFGIYLTLTGGDKNAETVPLPEGAPTDSTGDSASISDTEDTAVISDTVEGSDIRETSDELSQSTSAGSKKDDDGNGNRTAMIILCSAVSVAAVTAAIIIVVKNKKK